MKRAGSCSALHALAPCHSCSSSSIFVARIKAAALPQLLPLLSPLLLLLLLPLQLPLSAPSSGLHSAILFALRLLWHFYFTPLLGNIFWPCPTRILFSILCLPLATLLNFAFTLGKDFCPRQGSVSGRGRVQGRGSKASANESKKFYLHSFLLFLNFCCALPPAAAPPSAVKC